MKNNFCENTDIVFTFKFDNRPIFTFHSNIKTNKAECAFAMYVLVRWRQHT